MKLEFSWQIFEKPQIPNFMKIRPVGAKMSHAVRQTDMKLTVAFRDLVAAAG